LRPEGVGSFVLQHQHCAIVVECGLADFAVGVSLKLNVYCTLIRDMSFRSIALIAGFLGRIATGGLSIIFTGALIVHLPDGWTVHWFGIKKGRRN
jgi:hypothetical protein